MTKDEALNSITEIGEYEGWKMGTYSKGSVDNLIDKIYDSIGSCEECRFSQTPFTYRGYSAIRCSLYNCSPLIIKSSKGFCDEFERGDDND